MHRAEIELLGTGWLQPRRVREEGLKLSEPGLLVLCLTEEGILLAPALQAPSAWNGEGTDRQRIMIQKGSLKNVELSKGAGQFVSAIPS